MTIRGTCRLAFWHRPRYSAGKHGDQDDVSSLWRALRGRASLVINGHEHNMQRLRRRDGIVELVAGAGGRSRYKLDQNDRRLAWADATQEGALRIRLRPGVAEWDFVSVGGRTLDKGSAKCDGKPSPP
jgi:hypothetical protein